MGVDEIQSLSSATRKSLREEQKESELILWALFFFLLFVVRSSSLAKKRNQKISFAPSKITKEIKENKKLFHFLLFWNTSKTFMRKKYLSMCWRQSGWRRSALRGVEWAWNVRRHKWNSPGISFRRLRIEWNLIREHNEEAVTSAEAWWIKQIFTKLRNQSNCADLILITHPRRQFYIQTRSQYC